LIAFIPAGMNITLLMISFVIFRILDIKKPGPIGTIDEKLKGARGVMADDILAGIITAVIVLGLKYAGLG
jgi:phosphatidylglycerophosphatase A